MMKLEVNLSPGDFLDRMTILAIKGERFPPSDKRQSALSYLQEFNSVINAIEGSETLLLFYHEMKSANEAVWDVEEEIRQCDWTDDKVVSQLAKRLHANNDKRFLVKQRVDELLRSDISERKSYL